jgi:hypothetical protein
MRIPGMPASPKNKAYSDQANEAATPTEMSVSMVAAPCLALTRAARWNGHAPHTATGAASASDSHCQSRNCSAGTIASTTTGTASSSDISSRRRSAAVSSSRSCDGPVGSAPASGSAGGTGNAAV